MKKTFNRVSLHQIALLLFGIITLSFTGCLDRDTEDPQPQPTAYVSFYHGSPDASNLDVLINSARLFNQPIKYSDYTRYVGLTPGSMRIQFTPVNAINAIIDTTLTFRQDKVYSLFVVDKFQQMDVVAVKDSLVAPPAGKARIRLINLSPDAPNVELATTGTAGTTLFTNLGFKNNTEFKEIAAGTHTFQVKAAGSGEVLLPAPNVALEAGRIYTFILRGFVSPPSGNTNQLNLQSINNY